jgi:hypothetical protein
MKMRKTGEDRIKPMSPEALFPFKEFIYTYSIPSSEGDI